MPADLPFLGTSYSERLRTVTSEAYERYGADFHEICRNARGAFPLQVLQALPHPVDSVDLKKVVLPSPFLDTPEPHQLDSDWRFNRQSAEYVAGLLACFDRVLCVGTPTVYSCLAAWGREVCLVDRNPGLKGGVLESQHAHLFVSDARAFQYKVSHFDAAVIDPPWYPEDYASWVQAVGPSLRKNAKLYAVLFKELLRPQASQERAKILKILGQLGPVRHLTEPVTYTTPLFEALVLGRLGLPALAEWRTADLIEVTVQAPSPLKEEASVSLPAKDWTRFFFGKRVVAVRDDSIRSVTFSYIPPSGACYGYDLHTVSSRDPALSQINVWTSRSKAAVVQGTAKLSHVLALLRSGMRLDLACKTAAESAAEARVLEECVVDLDIVDGANA